MLSPPRRRLLAGPRTAYIVVTPPPAAVMSPPIEIEQRDAFESRAVPRNSGIVTTGYSTRSCYLDRNVFERCY